MNYAKCLCPDCQTGSIKELRGKYGKFYTCTHCDWKVTPTKLSKLVKAGTVRELTHEELVKLLVH
jgi:ssDNA-binding Zn-finger/Zn-ribbon topoisomerase 1